MSSSIIEQWSEIKVLVESLDLDVVNTGAIWSRQCVKDCECKYPTVTHGLTVLQTLIANDNVEYNYALAA